MLCTIPFWGYPSRNRNGKARRIMKRFRFSFCFVLAIEESSGRSSTAVRRPLTQRPLCTPFPLGPDSQWPVAAVDLLVSSFPLLLFASRNSWHRGKLASTLRVNEAEPLGVVVTNLQRNSSWNRRLRYSMKFSLLYCHYREVGLWCRPNLSSFFFILPSF